MWFVFITETVCFLLENDRNSEEVLYPPLPISEGHFPFSRNEHSVVPMLYHINLYLRMIEQSAIHVYAKKTHGQPSFAK